MLNYETISMNKEQFCEFIKFFDENIGTDYEVNADPQFEDKVYVVCFELEPNEVSMLEDFEETLTN